MCKCTPEVRAPFCGKPGCEWPSKSMEYRVKTQIEGVQADNELICGRLLGFEKLQGQHERGYDKWPAQWSNPLRPQDGIFDTLFFVTWDEVGLILDSLVAKGVYVSVHHGESGDDWKAVLHWQRYEKMSCKFGASGPLAIRAAALRYLSATT